MKTPKEIEIANAEYKQEMDSIGNFMNECVKVIQNGKEKASDVYKRYKQWAELGKENCMTQSKFGIEMGKRYQKKNINGYIYYVGFILKENDKSYVYMKED